MKQVLGHPTWHNVEKGTALITQEILQRQTKVDWIVGLTRGGLVPAVIMSHMLRLPMMPVNYSAPNGQGDNKNHNNNLPPIISEIAPSGGLGVIKPNLLIVDDIADSGHTMQDVHDHYVEQGYIVFTAALYWKDSSVFTPTFYVHMITDDSPWIEFPWEC